MTSQRRPPELVLGNHPVENWRRFESNINKFIKTLSYEPTEKQKIEILLKLGGSEIPINFHLALHLGRKKDLTFSDALNSLRLYFTCRDNVQYHRYLFQKRKQEEDETYEAFKWSLYSISYQGCKYGDELEKIMIRDQIIAGIRDEQMREKILLQKHEDVDTIDKVELFIKQHEVREKLKASKISKNIVMPEDTVGKSRKVREKCERCDKLHTQTNCPALKKRCKNCWTIGHFDIVCPEPKRESDPDSDVYE